MPLLSVGDKLGGKYFVISAREFNEEFFEVRDAQGAQSWAQLLAPTGISSTVIDGLAREVTRTVPGGAWLVPDAVVAGRTGVPVAVYSERPPAAFSEALADLIVEPSKPRARATLFRWFAALAEALGTAHAIQAFHGAVSLSLLRVRGTRDSRRLVLTGIGIDCARRSIAKVERAAPKADLAGLVVTLGKAMTAANLSPEGSGSARWNVLLQCARAGDHPAFGAGAVLAAMLNDFAAGELKPEAARKPTGTDNSGAFPAGKPGSDGDPKGKARGPVTSTQDFASFVPPPLAPERFWTPLRLRVALCVAGPLLVIGLSVALWRDNARPPPANAVARTALSTHVDRCGNEPVRAPLMVELGGASTELALACSPDSLRLTLVTQSEDRLVTRTRLSRRGGAFEAAVSDVSCGASQLGTAAVSREGAWVTWLQPDAVPFGVARVDRGVSVAAIQMPGWPSGAFRGAFMLHTDASGAYLASTLRTAAGSVVTVVRAAFEGHDERSVAYALGAGEVVAVIPGENATLLIREGSGLHTLRVPVTTLAVLATPTGDAGAADAGVLWAPVAIETRALPRSATLQAASEAMTVVREGAALSSGKTVFLVTEGDPQGRVILAEFPTAGDAQAVQLAPRGRGESLTQGAARPTGLYFSEAQRRAVMIDPDGNPQGDGAVGFASAGRAALVACGGETWMAFVTGSRAGAVPLPCVHER